MSETEKNSFSGFGLLETLLWFVMPPEALPLALQPGDVLLVCAIAEKHQCSVWLLQAVLMPKVFMHVCGSAVTRGHTDFLGL